MPVGRGSAAAAGGAVADGVDERPLADAAFAPANAKCTPGYRGGGVS